MKLTGIHFLLSYRCTDECDHCFVWGSPKANGTMTLAQVRDVLRQARDLGSVGAVYFEGGEPFLFYPILLQCLGEAAAMGFRRGIVTNCYWATSVEDAVEWLRPVAQIGVDDLSLSSDLFHGEAMMTQAARNAVEAAERLGLPEGVITIEPPEECTAYAHEGKGEPITGGQVMFRGRATAKLTEGVPRRRWTEFTECPTEDFVNWGRVHVDTYGNVQTCQGLVMGNLWQRPLREIVASYDAATHPIAGPLHEGGPVALVERYDLPHEETYIDACHLCYTARETLRARFPEFLAPGTVYGELDRQTSPQGK
jgi:MoaA/NifB/PqqE/SkfB family radical SAM enzyme